MILLLAALLISHQTPTFEELPAAPDGRYGSRSTFVAEASPAQVGALLSDIERYDGLFPSVHRVELLSRTPGRADRAEHIEANWVETFAGLEFDSRVRLSLAPRRRLVTFRSLDGAPSMTGRIEVRAHELGAEVVYETWIGAAFLSDFMLRSAARDQAAQMARAVRAHAPGAVAE